MRAEIRSSTRGFTLLEVMLALALAAVVIAAISMAIDVHLRVVDVGRTQIERDQLARTLLNRIADDIRGAVQRQEFDASAISSLLAGAGNASRGGSDDGSSSAGGGSNNSSSPGSGSSNGSSNNSSGGSSDDSSDDSSSTGGDSQSSDDEQTSIQSSAPAEVPGLYGNTYELQIDVSRMPRPDELTGLTVAANGQMTALQPSDVKTVSYFVQLPGASTLGLGAGLMRREVDHSVGLWSVGQGDVGIWDPYTVALAPEVVALEFRYFDGTSWLTEWDSTEYGGLPVAVEISIAITPPSDEMIEAQPLLLNAPMATIDPDSVYRLLVHLPAAQPLDTAMQSSEVPEDVESSSGAEGSNAQPQ